MSSNGDATTATEEQPSVIQSRVSGLLNEITGPLAHEREQLQALEADLSRQLHDARSARQRIDKVLGLLAPKDESAPKQVHRGKVKGQSVATEKLDAIVAATRAIGPHCKPTAILEQLDRTGTSMANPTLYAGLRVLREQERIFAAPDPTGRKDSKVYSVRGEE